MHAFKGRVRLAGHQNTSMLNWLKPSKRRGILQTAAPTLGTSATTLQVEQTTAPLLKQSSEEVCIGKTSSRPIETQDILQDGQVLGLKSAVCYLPHPDKVHYGGEDAHFISNVGGGALGVADGVGGWQESGVNPAEYSRRFMQLACAYLEGKDMFENQDKSRGPGPLLDPRGALDAAHAYTKVPGSATACVLQLDQANRMLIAANLGDSGFIIVRKGRILMRSKALQHYFDCPLQFGAFPEYVEATDTADMADFYSVPLLAGDVIVAGTDGLWDNAFDEEIIALMPKGPEDVLSSATGIAAVARQHASDQNFPSPYTREALSQGLDLPWWDKLLGASFKNGRFQLRQLTGGKMDDITVLVSYVAAEDAPAPPATPAATTPAAGASASVDSAPATAPTTWPLPTMPPAAQLPAVPPAGAATPAAVPPAGADTPAAAAAISAVTPPPAPAPAAQLSAPAVERASTSATPAAAVVDSAAAPAAASTAV